MIDKRKHPHLFGAMLMEGMPGTNLCIHRAAGFVLDTPGAELCFGTLRPRLDGPPPQDRAEPFIHAWAELRGQVYAPTTIEANGGRLDPFPQELYYAVNGVSDVRRLTRGEVLRLSGQIRLSAHLRRGTMPKASVGGTLLDAAGVSWKENEKGGLIPA